jgi:hypothetical protein
VFRNFPLTEIHPDAEPAAEAAEAAGARGRYWPMHDTIYEHQQDGPDALSVPALGRYAQRIGLDADAVIEEIAEDRYLERIRSDFMGGVRSGVTGRRRSSSTASGSTGIGPTSRASPTRSPARRPRSSAGSAPAAPLPSPRGGGAP